MNNYTQQYYSPMMPNYGYQPYQPMQQNLQQMPKQQEQNFKTTPLQGKSVDGIDVVKAMDIPLDGSISYFPITDGSAIVTKQLQPDGTSKTVIYKPQKETEIKKPKYVTDEELEEAIKNIDNDDIRDELKIIKKQIKNILTNIEEKGMI